MNLKKFFFILSSLAIVVAAKADIPGTWVHHPSLDIYSYLYASKYSRNDQATNNVQKLIETDKYLYALISTGLYVDGKMAGGTLSPYNSTPYVLARLDKSAENARMEAFATGRPVSGLGVTALEYFKKPGCLVAAYDNNCFDLIFDDGRIVSNTELTDYTRPGGTTIRSISMTPDGEKFVIATDFGVLIVNAVSAEIEKMINFSERVDFANIFGDYMVISNDNIYRVFPLSNPPFAISDAHLLKSDSGMAPAGLLDDGGILTTFGIYPLSEKSFLFLGPALNSNTDGYSANVLTLPDNPLEENCRIANLLSTAVNFKVLAATPPYNPGFPESPLIAPTRNGFMLHTENYIYLLDTDNNILDYSEENAEKNFAASVVKSMRKDQRGATDNQAGPVRYKQTSTYDGENFWVLVPRQGFQRLSATGTGTSATWTTDGDVVELNALAAGTPEFLYYSPEYGIIARNRGRNFLVENDNGQTDGFSTYKDGQWTVHSVSKTNYKGGWLYGTSSLLMGEGNGAYSDPVYPHYVYQRDRSKGILRQNINDYSDIMIMTRSNYAPAFANKVTVIDPLSGASQSGRCSFFEFDVDNDGTLWTAFRQIEGTNNGLQGELWYWTADDRGQVLKASDYAGHEMKKIVIPGLSFATYGSTFAPKMECNRNLIIEMPNWTEYDAVVYDHNGTPEDTSDDRYVILRDLEYGDSDNTGSLMLLKGFLEDPVDGTLIFGCRDGIFTATRESLFGREKPRIEWLKPINEKTGNMSSNFGAGCMTGCVGMTIDNEKRKWFVFENGEVLCLSADRSTIVGEYSPQNSPLPAGEYFGITYNPESNSLFIGTSYGITEYVLEGGSSPFVTYQPRVSPKIAEVHEAAYITISGLEDSGHYSVIDSKGEEYVLPSPAGGRIQLHPADYPSGTFTLKGYPEVEFVINR